MLRKIKSNLKDPITWVPIYMMPFIIVGLVLYLARPIAPDVDQTDNVPVADRLPESSIKTGFLEAVFSDQEMPHLCSGTLIDQDVLVTAAHCVFDKSKYRAARKVYFWPGGKRSIDLNVGEENPKHYRRFSKYIAINRRYLKIAKRRHRNESNPSGVVPFDLAIVGLRKLPSAASPGRLFGTAKLIDVKKLEKYSSATFIGYSRTSYGGSSSNTFSLRRKDCSISPYSTTTGAYEGECFYSRWDGSGGGVFVEHDGGQGIAAILSGHDRKYDQSILTPITKRIISDLKRNQNYSSDHNKFMDQRNAFVKIDALAPAYHRVILAPRRIEWVGLVFLGGRFAA